MHQPTNVPFPADVSAAPEHVAMLFLELVPVFFRTQRAEMKQHSDLQLSIPQIRTLRFVSRAAPVSLSAVAAHLDMTLPATSKLVDRLMQHDLLSRAVDADDRRRAELTLSDAGQHLLHMITQGIQSALAERLKALSADELAQCAGALDLLHAVLLPDVAATPRPRCGSNRLVRSTQAATVRTT